MKIRETIEKAMIAVVEARQVVISEEIPVVAYRDRLTQKGAEFITVHAQPEKQHEPQWPMYEVPLAVIADSETDADPVAARLDMLFAEVSGAVNSKTFVDDLQAAVDAIDPASGITIDGIIRGAGEDTERDYSMLASIATVFLTYEQ